MTVTPTLAGSGLSAPGRCPTAPERLQGDRASTTLAQIYLRPADEYVATGVEVAFATIVASARRRGEVAIGYRVLPAAEGSSATQGVRLNPPKSGRVTLGPRDAVIVLAV